LKERVNDLNLHINVLSRIKYEIEREMGEMKYYGIKPSSEQFTEDLNLKYTVISNNIISKLKDISKAKSHFKTFQKTAHSLMRQNIR
jgi:hypothetical protein